MGKREYRCDAFMPMSSSNLTQSMDWRAHVYACYKFNKIVKVHGDYSRGRIHRYCWLRPSDWKTTIEYDNSVGYGYKTTYQVTLMLIFFLIQDHCQKILLDLELPMQPRLILKLPAFISQRLGLQACSNMYSLWSAKDWMQGLVNFRQVLY